MNPKIRNGVRRQLERTLVKARRLGFIRDPQAMARAKMWMENLEAGNATDYRSLLFVTKSKKGGKAGDRLSYAEIISRFDPLYQEGIMNSALPDNIVRVLWDEIERGQREKIGPKSMFKPFSLDGADKVAELKNVQTLGTKLKSPEVKRALERLRELLPGSSLIMQSIEDGVKDTGSLAELHSINTTSLDTSTNSGPPYFVRGFKPNYATMKPDQLKLAEEVFKYYMDLGREYVEALRSGRKVRFRAAIAQRLVSRGLKPYDPKSKRIVSALEKTEAIIGKMFMAPLQEAMKHVTINGICPVAAWHDLPFIDNQIQLMLDQAATNNLAIVSGDISSYDQSFAPDLMSELGRVASAWFKSPAEQRQVENHFNSVAYAVGLFSPTQVFPYGPTALPSGSVLTNGVGTLGNILTQMVGEELGLYRIISLQAQGDDFLCLGNDVTPETIQEAYSFMGFEAHKEKQFYERGFVQYLQRLHIHKYYGGIASAYRTLGSTLVYERMRFKRGDWNPYLEAIQTIAKLGNLEFHPAFETVVNFIKSGDKYELGANLSASDVIRKAGELSEEVLAQAHAATLNPISMDDDSSFSRSAINGVLRGEILPPFGSRERFLRVYGKERIDKALS